MKKLIRCQVGSQIWLVPPDLVTDEFRAVIGKINRSCIVAARPVEFTESEYRALEQVHFHPDVWKL